MKTVEVLDQEQLLLLDFCGRVEVTKKIDIKDERTAVSQLEDKSKSEGNNPKRKKKVPLKLFPRPNDFLKKSIINLMEEDCPNLCSLSSGEIHLELFNDSIILSSSKQELKGIFFRNGNCER